MSARSLIPMRRCHVGVGLLMSGRLAIGRLLTAGLIVVAALLGQAAPALAMLAIINDILAVLAVTETRARLHRHADAW